MSSPDFVPTSELAKRQQNALVDLLTTQPLPVEAQLVIGRAAAFLAEVQRVLPDTPTSRQKRRVSA